MEQILARIERNIMVGLTHSKNGHGAERIPPMMNVNSVGSNVRNMTNGNRKSVAYREQAGELLVQAEMHVLPVGKAKKPATETGEKVAKALAEDGDPGKLLTEVRDILFGPTRKLQEARLEEFVVILEELDRETKVTNQGFAEQIKNLDTADRQRVLDLTAVNQKAETLAAQHDRELAAIHKKIDALSERVNLEMQRSAEIHKRELDEQSNLFASKLERQSAQMLKHLGEMADLNKLSIQTLTTEFSTQLRELSLLAKAGDDKIMARLDERVTQIETNMEDEKRRGVKVMTESLNILSERFQTL
jgi:hypothetical protein